MRRLSWLILGAPFIANSAFAATDRDATNGGQAAITEADSKLSVASGVDYSVGHYGDVTDTTVWSIPVDLKAQLGRIRLQASLPYEFIKGPGQLVGGVIVSAPGGATTSRSGVGDLTMSAAYTLIREQGALPMLEIGGSVKAPTAKQSIGTGKADYSISASAYKTVATNFIIFASAGYSWLGSPAAYHLENGFMASGGFNLRPSPSQNIGASVAYREPVVAGLKGQAVVSPYWTIRASKLWGVTLYGMAGLNNASPRLGAGLRLTMFK